jgi:hypothetical protein
MRRIVPPQPGARDVDARMRCGRKEAPCPLVELVPGTVVAPVRSGPPWLNAPQPREGGEEDAHEDGVGEQDRRLHPSTPLRRVLQGVLDSQVLERDQRQVPPLLTHQLMR